MAGSDQSRQPKYSHVKDLIVDMIRSQGLAAGDQLPTELELAEKFGVSRNTVRQAVSELVSEGLVSKQQGSGTYYNGHKGEEANHRGLIGVITPLARSYIFGEIIHGMDDVAHEMGFSLVLASTDANPERELEALKNILSKPIDGLLVEFARSAELNAHSELKALLHGFRGPIVVCDAETPGLDASIVSVDDMAGGRLATEFLIRHGHRRIGIIYKRTNMAGVIRKRAFLAAMEEAGIATDPDLIRSYAIQEEHLPARAIMEEFVAMPVDKRPTAVFFFNDQCAVQSISAVTEAGLSVPDDISFIGYDDSELAAAASVPLTTVVHPKYHLGWLAARTLIDLVKSGSPYFHQKTLIRPSIIVRESVKTLLHVEVN